MNTEDDGARGDDEQPQPQQPQPNDPDHDAGPEDVAGAESAADAATPPPAEPPVEPPSVDQPSAEQLGAQASDTPGGGAGGDPWEEATAAQESSTGAEAGAGTETGAGAGAGTSGGAGASGAADSDAGAGTSGAAGSGPDTEEYARRFLDSVDGFLSNLFREASEFVDRSARRETPPRDERERTPEDYAGRVLDSVEGWMSDFFRGASMARTAAGFGRAAAGSAFRARQRAEDVWAQATSTQDSDAGRECRYCPFCQTMAVVRNSRPELYEQIGDTAKTLVDLIRQAAEQSRRPRR